MYSILSNKIVASVIANAILFDKSRPVVAVLLQSLGTGVGANELLKRGTRQRKNFLVVKGFLKNISN